MPFTEPLFRLNYSLFLIPLGFVGCLEFSRTHVREDQCSVPQFIERRNSEILRLVKMRVYVLVVDWKVIVRNYCEPFKVISLHM